MTWTDAVAWIALLVAAGGWISSYRSARAAEVSAGEAKRSADAANEQVELMKRAEVEAQQDRDRQAIPSLRAHVSMHHTQSFLCLLNQGTQAIHLREVKVAGEPFAFMKMVITPVPNFPDVVMSILPNKIGAIFQGIHMHVSTPVACRSELDWSPLDVEFNYGIEGVPWLWACEVTVLKNGLIEMRNGTLTRVNPLPS